MSLVLRAGTAADSPVVAAVHVESWQAAYRGLLPPEFLEALSVLDRREMWDGLFAEGSFGQMVVAELDDELVGFATVGPSREDLAGPDNGELGTFYLRPRVWGQGVAGPLHAEARALMVTAGYTDAILWALVGNERAHRFYLRQGWAPDGAQRTELRGEVTLAQARYRLRLAGGV